MIPRLALLTTILAFAGSAASQTPAPKDGDIVAPDVTTNLPANYVLGPNDQFSLAVDQLQDNFTDKTFRIDGQGDVTLPLIGRAHAGGLTASQFEDVLKAQFSSILKAPDIVVTVTEFASQPVSVQGALNTPGVHQLSGRKTLFEMLALCEGLRPDAGTTITVTRDLKWGAIPLPGATLSSTGEFSVATVRVKNVMKATSENLVMMPGDTVFVPKADIVYAVGSVGKPGGFPIGENDALSALQVVSLSEGLLKTAAAEKAMILRMPAGGGPRQEIPINLKLLMTGRSTDVALQPDDILFVPNSSAKTVAYRSLEAIVTAATGLAIYGRY